MDYERLIEEQIALKLKTSGAVVVAGPKFCGKTTTCMLYQKSFVKLNTKQAIAMARMNPKAVLVGENPRLIDEWQKAPDIWNQVKDELDFNYEFGKYILTGSSTPADKTEVHHSGAGRITELAGTNLRTSQCGRHQPPTLHHCPSGCPTHVLTGLVT